MSITWLRLDRQTPTRVKPSMRRGWKLSLVAVALAAAGCGSKSTASTTPGSSPGKDGEIPTTPLGEGEVKDPILDSSADTAVPVPETPNTPSSPGPATPSATSKFKPPGLDLTPEQKSAKVNAYLRNARTALRGSKVDADTGIEAARAALSVDETNIEAMLLLAYGNYRKGYYDKAEYILGRAKGNSQQSASYHYIRGLVFQATKRDDDAYKSLKMSVKLRSNYRPALLNLGVYHLRNKRYQDAVTLYEKLTGPLGDKAAVTWTNLGSAYRGMGGQAGLAENTRKNWLLQSETALKRALVANSKYANAYYNLGLLYLDADPFPLPNGTELDSLKRLSQAKTYFDEYRKQPGADLKKADVQAAVAQKLHAREVRVRDKRRKREERRRKRELRDIRDKKNQSGGN